MYSKLASVLVLAVTSGCWTAVCQMDEKPPVLKRGSPIPQSSKTSTTSESTKAESNIVTASGVIKHLDANLVVIQADDTRILTCKITASTALVGPDGKLTVDDFDPGMRVSLKARIAPDSDDLTATSITLDLPADKPKDLKTATIDGPPDEEGRPVLRRGKPAKRQSSDDDEEGIASVKPPAKATADSVAPEPTEETKAPVQTGEAAQHTFLKKAQEVTFEFSSKLPNFVCQQFTTRYERESRISGWNAKDIVSASLVYVDGAEDYQNIKVGNKSVAKGMMDVKGQTSTGDFNSALLSIMESRSAAEFHFVKDADLKRLKAKVYDFSVSHDNSNWEIKTGGQSVLPAYSGRMWIDRESGRVLRMERQADKIPESFPMDMIEQTVDYDFVTLGNRKVLLPTESENLSCQRGSSLCSKNTIEFRNYKEFRGQATIEFDK